ncbi:hypothetical protein ORI20_30120 [Mycobacterium sp. CVI_P3]|uniref:Uncharacterized protein n=1 Tax=Mycobacterium pinniadriaticum TaxID=2994102 RepID=A0ABT3SN61_9MYCO|nr:hypothetical protein [Mycobacterium pinniadriaticum]MCX2934528.1 hypothetical protein [Mycobacterium pinniadriaticum]MCX2940951.1 hypothetical protein [Mycobacterium pinniadriaticum]
MLALGRRTGYPASSRMSVFATESGPESEVTAHLRRGSRAAPSLLERGVSGLRWGRVPVGVAPSLMVGASRRPQVAGGSALPERW